jgi:diacylglycerol kinase (ATP)
LHILYGMQPYTAISIIYNPASTGPSKRNALTLSKALQFTAVNHIVEVVPTLFPGHAESLAYDLAMASSHPLIISSSGDGGYNEIVNGVLRAQLEGAHPTCGLLPSGNANDHYRNVHRGPLVDQILKGEQLQIDMLSIESFANGHPWKRHAHSYIGVGLTPTVGEELNKVELNRWREAWIVLKTLYKFQPSRLIVHGKERRYDSLIFSNVGRMSKVLSLSDTAELTDGKFEVISFRSHSRSYLVRRLLKAMTFGLHTDRKVSQYDFTTVKPTHIQLDGEVFSIDANATVKIRLEPKVLRCVI